MSEDRTRTDLPGPMEASPTSDPEAGTDLETDASLEAGPAPTPFDHPLFLPAVCIGFTLWFGYDTFIHPMEEHMDFNFYGFKVVLAAAVWYSYLAWCETQGHRVRPWVLPSIFAALAAWLAAEAFAVPGFELGELIEYPDISRFGFYLALALIPLTALREWMRARRAAAIDDATPDAAPDATP